MDALALYRIRLWCAQFVNPNILYQDRIQDGKFLDSGNAKTVELIRESYATFMEFMEKEYSKIVEYDKLHEESPMLKGTGTVGGKNYRYKNAMVVLRKIQELPY